MSPQPNSTEHPVRDGAPPNDGPVAGPPGPSAEIDRDAAPGGDAPTGLPDEAGEETPLGATDEAPEGDAEPQRGDEAMPGIPTGGEPPSAG
jgi:hypothetical protein